MPSHRTRQRSIIDIRIGYCRPNTGVRNAALMAVRHLKDPQLSAVGLPYVVENVLGHTMGKIALAAVAVAIFVCILANQTGAMRIW